jgi:hypothetical protein
MMTTAWGSTNFQSVIDLLVRIRRDHPTIPIADYPAGASLRQRYAVVIRPKATPEPTTKRRWRNCTPSAWERCVLSGGTSTAKAKELPAQADDEEFISWADSIRRS